MRACMPLPELCLTCVAGLPLRWIRSLVIVYLTLVMLSSSTSTQAQSPADWEVWRVFVPAEEVGNLVPLDYSLIEVEDLAEALKREETRRAQVQSVGPHIAESIYVVRANADYLVSDQCRWTVRSQQPAAKLKLQELSVALRNSAVTPTEDKSLLPSLRYLADGTTTLVNIAGDTNYWFGMSASPSSTSGTRTTYELTLPPATMAKMLIAAPETMVISSPDVIVTEVNDPSTILPENWPVLPALERQRWYLIHISGKSQCRLVTQIAERRDSMNYQRFVRRVTNAYEVSSKGVTLTGEFDVERLHADEPLRMILDKPLKIRAVAVDDKAIPYRVVDSTDDEKHTIELPIAAVNGRTRIRIEAFCEIAFPFNGNLPNVGLDKAYAWDGRTTVTADDDLQIEEISFVGRTDLAKPKLESTTIGRRWSADWLGAVPSFSAKVNRPSERWSASTLTRLTIQQDWIAATTNLRLASKGLQSNELRLDIGDGWFIDDLAIEQSDSQVNFQLPDGEAGDVILTWDRLSDEMSISLQIVAHLPRETNVDQFDLLAPRVATVRDSIQEDLYAIEQTGRRRIQPDPLLQRLQVRGSEIADWQVQLLSQLNTSQLYRGFNDRLPPLVLKRASGTYTANVRTLGKSTNGQLQITHRVEMEPTAGPIDSVSCLLNVPAGMATPAWRVTQDVDGELIQLSKAVVKANRNGADARGETRFDVQLPESTADSFVLQCDLLVPVASDGSVSVPLVTTPVATDTWLILPRQYSLLPSTSGVVALPSSICCEAGELAESLGEDAASVAAYRYDPTLVSAVDLRLAGGVSESGAWVWDTLTEHWLYNDGRMAHRSRWEVFAPESMTLLIDLPVGWVVNQVAVDGQPIALNHPVDSLQLPIAIPSGERVRVSVQSLSLASEPKWYSSVVLAKPHCEIATLKGSEFLMLQPGRLSLDEVFNEQPLSAQQRLMPTNLWRWLSPAPQYSSARVEAPAEEDGWRRVELTAGSWQTTQPINQPMIRNASSSASFASSALTIEDADAQALATVGPSSSTESTGAQPNAHSNRPLTRVQETARVRLIDRSSLCAICIALMLAGAGWSYTVLGNRPTMWWFCLTLAGLAVLLVLPQHIIFAQLSLLSLTCGALARLVQVVAGTKLQRHGGSTRRGSTVVRSSSMAAWLVAVGSLAIPSQVHGQSQTADPLKKRDASPTIYGVLIPLNEEGELSAKHVYVPNKLMSLLDATETSGDDEVQPQILNAKYTVRLRSDTSLTTSYVQEFTVEFDLLFNSIDIPLRLPFLKSQLQLLRGSVSGQEIYIGQRLFQSNEEITFSPVEVGRVRLRLQLIPVATEAAGRSSFEVSIPKVASSTLEVLAGDAMDVEVKGLGAVRRLTAASWTAELGPTNVLQVNWPTRSKRVPISSLAQSQSDTWLHIHEGQVIADCQLRVSGANTLPSQLHVMVDAGWEPVGSQWQDARYITSELSAIGSRRIYTVDRDSLSDRMVIRALMVPRNSDGQLLSIPFFSLQENVLISRTLALSGIGRPRWKLNGNEFWSRLASSAADLGWEVNKPAMTDAWRVPTGSLNGTLQRIAPMVRSVVDEKSELQVLSTGTQLSYRADWTQTGDDQIMKLELPPEAEVQSVVLNGMAADYQLSQANGRSFLTVRAMRVPADIRTLQMQLQLKPTQPSTALPRILLQDVAISSSQYLVSCGSELDCTLKVSPEIATQDLVFNQPLQDSSVMLNTLTAPIGVAELGSRFQDAVHLPATVEVKTRKPATLVTSAIAFSRSELGWRATVEVLLNADGGLNFAFFDVPSSIRDLIESTGSPYRVSASGTSGRSTLCLLPRVGEDGKARASFAFRLSALGSSSSLAIPDIVFLGERAIRPTLALPTKIDGQPVRWSRAGRRLDNQWLQNSGLSLASQDYVSFEMSEVQQQASWRPAKLESKSPEILFQWATIEQDTVGNFVGSVNYWMNPNSHLEVAATIPSGVELIGVQTGTSGAVWHKGSKGKVRVLMQPSYLPVHLRLLLKWSDVAVAQPTGDCFGLDLPAIDALSPKQMPVAIKSPMDMRVSFGDWTEAVTRSEHVNAPELEPLVEFDDLQFNAMKADRWSKLLLKTLPVVSDLDGEELASWIRAWSPSVASLATSQPIASSGGANSDFDEADRDTVLEFWDWYLGQLSEFDIEVLSMVPPASEQDKAVSGRSRMVDQRFGGAGATGSFDRVDAAKTVDEFAGDAKWYVVETGEVANAKLALRIEAPEVEPAATPWLFAAILFASSTGIYLGARRVQRRAAELLAQHPWLYWAMLAGVCWLIFPIAWPSIIIAVCAVGLIISQLLSTRRKQLALRR